MQLENWRKKEIRSMFEQYLVLPFKASSVTLNINLTMKNRVCKMDFKSEKFNLFFSQY